MNNKLTKVLYLGNLPPSYSEKKLEQLLSSYGKIDSLKIAKNYLHPNEQLDFAFVSLNSLSAMEKASQELNNTFVEGNFLIAKVIDYPRSNPPSHN